MFPSALILFHEKAYTPPYGNDIKLLKENNKNFFKYIMKIGHMLTRSSEIVVGFFYYKLKICQNLAVEFCEYKTSGTLFSSGNSGHWQFQ